MATAEEIRRALVLVTTKAVDTANGFVADGTDTLLVATPEIVAYYSDGAAALAADHYDELRAEAGAGARYTAEVVVDLREERIRRGVLWASSALVAAEPDEALAKARLAEVVQFETARPFRLTITNNARHDPDAIGWQRIAGNGCKFCRMLAGRGAVYRAETARFASHPHCDCTAQPVFDGTAGPEASVMQYVASKRHRSASEKRALREYLAAMPD